MKKETIPSNIKMKAECRKKIVELKKAVDHALERDSAECGLLPALYKAASYFWCNSNYSKK